jgi:hypothetical protein
MATQTRQHINANGLLRCGIFHGLAGRRMRLRPSVAGDFFVTHLVQSACCLHSCVVTCVLHFPMRRCMRGLDDGMQIVTQMREQARV